MSCRLYAGGISHRARERDVEKLFSKFGRIRDVSLKNGFAFVEFDDDRDADDAVYDLNRTTFMGERISVEFARGTPHGRDKDRFGGGRYGRDRTPPRGGRGERRPSWMDKYGAPERTDYKLIVENLSSRVSWQDLKDYMRQAGEVCYADAHKNHKGEGVVEFANQEDLRNAMDKLDGTELNGRKIKLIESKRRRRRSKSASRSKSRSRSPKRSRSRSRSRERESKRKSRSRSRSRTPRSRDGSRERNSGGRSRSGSRGRDHDNGRGRVDGDDDEGGRGRRGSESD